ncbi:MAG: methyltransferase [Holosporaceae bacterium]|jgi:tRNA1(Val) A37 N6-methylase TrmN6|nr:methyltransferase [Holosporaceae bacterium]
MELTKDYILKGKLSLLQPKHGYRVAIDPIILAGFVSLQHNQSVLDVGCGVGTISLILKLRNPSAIITAIDVDPDICDICLRNAKENSLDLDVVNIGIENFHGNPSYNGKTFDHIVTNPPFFSRESFKISNTKLLANFETIELTDWISFCLKKLKNGGTLHIIHHASRISDILSSLGQKVGAIEITPVFPKKDMDAIRIIVSGKKGSRKSTKITGGLVLHDNDGNFSKIAQKILESQSNPLQ